jgi:hypothetical protein
VQQNISGNAKQIIISHSNGGWWLMWFIDCEVGKTETGIIHDPTDKIFNLKAKKKTNRD